MIIRTISSNGRASPRPKIRLGSAVMIMVLIIANIGSPVAPMHSIPIAGGDIDNGEPMQLEPLLRSRRMNNGQELEFERAPFMARLIKSTGYSRMFCSATVISPHFLLTAGHCVMDYYRIQAFVGNDTYKVENALLHENYKFYYEDDAAPPLNDIALVRVRGKIKGFEEQVDVNALERRGPGVALARPRDVPHEADNVQVYGYGFKSVDEESNIPYRERPLKTIRERVQSIEECRKAEEYATRDLTSVFCAVATGPGSGGACVGDSGGPAFIAGRLAGVFSFLYGTYCNTSYGPDLFTRVDRYYQWTLDNTAEDAEGIRARSDESTTTNTTNTTKMTIDDIHQYDNDNTTMHHDDVHQNNLDHDHDRRPPSPLPSNNKTKQNDNKNNNNNNNNNNNSNNYPNNFLHHL